MAVNATERITISDFRPGIYSDWHALTLTPAEVATTTTDNSNIPVDGAATIENTYKCAADRSGALVPLPALTADKTSARLPTASNADAKYVTGMEASYLLDALVVPNMYVEGTNTAADSNRHAVFTMYGMWYETDFFKWTVIAQLHRRYQSTQPSHDLMFSKGASTLTQGQTTQAHIGGGNFTLFRARDDINSNFTTQCVAWCAYGSPGYGTTPPEWASGAMSAGDQALTDFDTHNGAVYPDYDSYRLLGIFPDPYDGTDSASYFLTIAGFTAVTYLTTHQGRLIGLSRDHGNFGTFSAVEHGSITEHVHYTPPYDFNASLGIGDLEFGTFGESKPYLSGCAVSITANDLLLIKDVGGGVLVRGDLDDPTIVQLPFVHSTQGVKSIPVQTPIGLIYGGRSGVYQWTGGEATEHISPQIDGFFWNTDTEGREHHGPRGRFAWWDPYVAVPNNYLYDTRHKSWWRLDDPANLNSIGFNCYDVASSDLVGGAAGNTLYAFPWKLASTSATPMWYTANPYDLAASYSWQSQPLVKTRDKLVSVKRIKLLATPATANTATVAVTISGFGADGTAITPVTKTLDLAAFARPQQVECDVGDIIASYVQVRVVATGTGAAPKIHSLSLDVADRQHIAKQDGS